MLMPTKNEEFSVTFNDLSSAWRAKFIIEEPLMSAKEVGSMVLSAASYIHEVTCKQLDYVRRRRLNDLRLHSLFSSVVQFW